MLNCFKENFTIAIYSHSVEAEQSGLGGAGFDAWRDQLCPTTHQWMAQKLQCWHQPGPASQGGGREIDSAGLPSSPAPEFPRHQSLSAASVNEAARAGEIEGALPWDSAALHPVVIYCYFACCCFIFLVNSNFSTYIYLHLSLFTGANGRVKLKGDVINFGMSALLNCPKQRQCLGNTPLYLLEVCDEGPSLAWSYSDNSILSSAKAKKLKVKDHLTVSVIGSLKSQLKFCSWFFP